MGQNWTKIHFQSLTKLEWLKISIMKKTKVHIVDAGSKKTEKFIGILGNHRIGMVQK
jgi:hypothetical protein